MELKNYIPWPRISGFPAQEGARGKRALGKGVLDKNGSASEGSVRGSYPRRSWAKGGGGSGGKRRRRNREALCNVL